jgi:integrase
MSIKKYTEEGVVFFQVDVSLKSKSGKRFQKRSVGVKTFAEATRLEKTLLLELQMRIDEFGARGPLWADLVEKFEIALSSGAAVVHKTLSRATVSDCVRAIQIYTEEWNTLHTNQITNRELVNVWDRLCSEGKSNSRKRWVFNSINKIFKWAVYMDYLSPDYRIPTLSFKISKEEITKPEILNLSQIKALLISARELEHPWRQIWAGALLTGMRSGELFALEWKDIDLESKTVSVSRTWNGRFKEFKCTKGGYWREVPINSDLEVLLKELKATNPDSRFVFPRILDWSRGEAARVLRTFCVGAGIPSIKFHTLRACFATQLLKDKIAPAVVMKICGWKDLKTMQRYIRLAGIEIDGATDQLRILPPEQVMGRVVSIFRG